MNPAKSGRIYLKCTLYLEWLYMAMDPRTGGFLMITGVTFAAFASGFGDCLFDIDKIDACIAVSRHWEEILQQTGTHIVNWAIVLVKTVLNKS